MGRADAIILTGQDSIDFVNQILRPSSTKLPETGVSIIQRDSDGAYYVVVQDLDLDFLEDKDGRISDM